MCLRIGCGGGAMTTTTKTLADFMRQSDTDPFLLAGPQPPKVGWVYRDFSLMPQVMWIELLDLLGGDQIEIVAANSRQLPPAVMCRAQIWIGPAAQAAWCEYLRTNA